MAPLTRFRGTKEHVHSALGKEYYSQRASSGGVLIITEATFVAPQAGGMPNVPGCWNDEQTKAWKDIVDAVHAKGSFIYLQLWFLGRAAKADVLKAEGGHDVVSASDIPFEGGAKPRPLTKDEIKEVIGYYAEAAVSSTAIPSMTSAVLTFVHSAALFMKQEETVSKYILQT